MTRLAPWFVAGFILFGVSAASAQPVSSTTQAERDDAAADAARRGDDDGDGRTTDWLWLEGGGGASYANLRAIKQENFLPELVDVTETGGHFTFGAGMRFLRFLAVGARFGYSAFDSFGIGTVGAEVGLRIPIFFLEPYVRAGFGYAWMGAPDYQSPGISDASIYGYHAELDVGLDFFLGKYISVGAGFAANILNLTRQSFGANPAGATTFDFTQEGNSVGIQLRGHAHVGLHF
jgi:hypothetical protein